MKPIKLGCLLKGHNKVDQGLLGHNEVYQGITRQIKNEYKLQEITQKKSDSTWQYCKNNAQKDEVRGIRAIVFVLTSGS